jgi:hypothetical protein
MIAWQYFLTEADGAIVGETEFEPRPGGSQEIQAALKIRAVSRSRFAEATVAALQAANSLEAVHRNVFEPRFLRIAAVYFAGLWLHSEAEDLILPIGDPPKGLETNRPYSEEQIIAVLQPIAERNKAFHDSSPR